MLVCLVAVAFAEEEEKKETPKKENLGGESLAAALVCQCVVLTASPTSHGTFQRPLVTFSLFSAFFCLALVVTVWNGVGSHAKAACVAPATRLWL